MQAKLKVISVGFFKIGLILAQSFHGLLAAVLFEYDLLRFLQKELHRIANKPMPG